ncbi:MAG: beta-L-arabinofuranosidase domain-containing protein [Verrucomicrobiota bacterium]|jgi:DUF1680 family protein
MKSLLSCLLTLACCAAAFAADDRKPNAAPEPLPFRTVAGWKDTAEVLSPSAIHVDGWLGARIMANATNRLLTVDTEPLLAGFRKRPGVHPWIGEHVGKWMHAATLAWAYSGDPRLRAKLDRVAADLIAAQEPDGYLGTYVPEKRFGLYQGADWDVWSHKYNLMGLLTYYQYTGNESALTACRKMGDLLINTFGPGKKSILSAGTHQGMAATSVLEPVVLLYRCTGDERYLDFARYIVKSWDEPNGPKIIQALLTEKQVNKTANGKAYEMLSNLVGLCELARATGDRNLVEPVLNAWQDIVNKRLYITGSASQGEHFHGDYDLPNQTGAHVAETCVTTTWIQLNLQLLRLTGDAKFANELEKTLYNHLAAAQHPRGDDWCYFTALEGRKPYESGINCCHSSGPRGMALAPFEAYLKQNIDGADALLVGTFETSSAVLELGGKEVRVEQRSKYPSEGGSELRVQPSKPARFAMLIRVPPWSNPLRLSVNGKALSYAVRKGWAMIPAREWSARDRIDIGYSLGPRMVLGEHGSKGLAALEWGPFVLAYDAALNSGLPPASLFGFAGHNPVRLDSDHGALQVLAEVRSPRFSGTKLAAFVPFADAGARGGTYRVWLQAPGTPIQSNDSLLAGGQESRSRQGNVEGSINDGDTSSFVVTFDNRKRDEDWFAVTLDQPVTISRVVFVAGNVFHDGGWFDASAGKPRIQVQREPGGKWETLAEIADYPATTATDSASLADEARRTFTVRLEKPEKAAAVRVIGKPACGDNPRQAFSSCAELQAFGN